MVSVWCFETVKATFRTSEAGCVSGRLACGRAAVSPRVSSPTFFPTSPRTEPDAPSLEVLATRRLLPDSACAWGSLLRSFQRVAFTYPTQRLLDSCRMTRLNGHYQPALELCRLFLEQAGVSLEDGSVAARSYFFPMEMVFQEATTTFLRDRLRAVSRQTGRSYQSVAGTPTRSITFAADIVIGDPPELVIDTKYAAPELQNQYGGQSFRNEHVYQVVFYALSLGCPAVLVYPKVERDIDVAFDVEGIRVTLLTVDLSKPRLLELEMLATESRRFSRSTCPHERRHGAERRLSTRLQPAWCPRRSSCRRDPEALVAHRQAIRIEASAPWAPRCSSSFVRWHGCRSASVLWACRSSSCSRLSRVAGSAHVL